MLKLTYHRTNWLDRFWDELKIFNIKGEIDLKKLIEAWGKAGAQGVEVIEVDDGDADDEYMDSLKDQVKTR